MRGRIPKPWLRKSTGHWYVTLDGKQTDLGTDKRAAHAEFARLMVSRGRGPQSPGRLTVAQLCDTWLASVTPKLSRTTERSYRHYAGSLSNYCGGLRLVDLRGYHVTGWLDSHQWSQASRSLAVAVAKMVSRWGHGQGYLDSDPLARVPKPEIPRRIPTTLEEFENLLIRLPPWAAQALLFLRLTGLRIGELCAMQIEGCNLSAASFGTRGKTGERICVMSNAACDLLRHVIGDRTRGPVWRGGNGQPLRPHALQKTVRRYRRGELAHVVPHGMRGLFATEALRAGVDGLLVARLLGQKGTRMLAKHYANLDDEAMLKEAAEKASSGTKQG